MFKGTIFKQSRILRGTNIMRDYAHSRVALLALCISFLLVSVTLFSSFLDTARAQNEPRLSVVIDAANCFLTVEGEVNQPHYSAIDAVDIVSTETLQSHCIVENFSTSSVLVTPLFETRLLRSDGDIVSTSGGETASITLAPREKKIIVTSLPKPTVPQYYVVTLRYGDESNEVSYRYVLQGSNVTIKNSSVYITKQGESKVANVSFIWVPPATFYENSRIGKNPALLKPSFTISVTDESNVLCAEPISQIFSNPRVNAELSIPLISLCTNPKVTIIPANSDEEIPVQKVKDSEQITPVLSDAAPTKFWTLYTACIAFFISLLILIGGFVILRKKGILIAIILITGSGALLQAPMAQAQWSCGCVVSYGSGPCHYEPAEWCGGSGWVNGGSVPFNFTYFDYQTQCEDPISVTATCSDPGIAQCGSTNNSCTVGTLSDTADDATNYLWDCLGSTSNANCSLTKSVNGVCGATSNTCTAGTFSDSADGYGTSLWSCLGAGTGTTANCSIRLPPPSVVASSGSCTVPAYSNYCVATITWTFSNPLQPGVYKNNGTGLISGAASEPGYPLTVWMGGYDNTVVFKDDPNSFDFDYSTWQIGSVTPTLSCAASTTWNGSVCTPTLSGSCGAAARLYTATESTYQGSYCGNPFYGISATPAFPAQGATSTWSCLDSDGVARNQCSASRAAATTNLISTVLPNIASGSLIEGTDVTFKGSVLNNGTANVTSAFSDNFTYCWGSSCSPATMIGGHISESALSSTMSRIDTSSSFNLTNAGILRIQHCVDSQGQIAESSETIADNCKTDSFTVTAPNVLPTASAGADQYITLPTDSVDVSDASASDSDGSVASTVWSTVASPFGLITGGNTLTPTFSDMQTAGIYQYRLTVTDSQGGEQTDDMSVFVNPVPQCADGIDNDGDGFIDMLDTAGCVDGSDTDETDVFPPPTISINASSNNTVFINPDETVTVSWDTNNGNETLCTLTTSTNPDSIGDIVIDPLPGVVGSELGTLVSDPITVKTRFTVTCAGLTDSIVVEIVPSAFES